MIAPAADGCKGLLGGNHCCGLRSDSGRSNQPDHDPWSDVLKHVFRHDFNRGNVNWGVPGLHEIYRNPSVLRPEYTRWNFDDPGEGSPIADGPDTFRAMPEVHPEVLVNG